MSTVLCLESDCNETVQLPEDLPVAAIDEYLPPQEREIEIVCAKGHRKVYVVKG